MIERLSVEQVIRLNEIECAKTGENHALLDRDGLEAAVERPWGGFGDEEFFPTLYDKAAALLHGIAARQVFENGNKRTAWIAAVTTLDINGIDIGKVETVQSDMFVRAAALDHSLGIADIAEWFEVAHLRRRAGYAIDPRVEYVMLARRVDYAEEPDSPNLVNVHLATIVVEEAPAPVIAWLVTRIHWAGSDLGRSHTLSAQIEQDGKLAAPLRRPDGSSAWESTLDAPAVGGHPHHQAGVMPTLTGLQIGLSVIKPGRIQLRVELDGQVVGRIPLQLVVEPAAFSG